MENSVLQNAWRIFGPMLLLLSTFAPLRAHAAFDAELQGLSTNSTTWISGNLMGWAELDYIPCRVYFTGGPANGKVITIQFDHIHNNIPGFEDLTGWTPSSNVVITVPPVLSAPYKGTTWSYTFTINLTSSSPGWVEFKTRMAAGAHLNAGSSLGLSGTPSLGTLQIHKPLAGVGHPNLGLVKRGPVNAAPGETITYTVRWTNQPSFGKAVGVQVSDMLPPELTYVTNSASGNGRIIGNMLIWDLGNLQLGAQGTVSYRAVVNTNVAYGTRFANYAQILSSEDDQNPADNVSSVETLVIFNRPPVGNDDNYSVDEDTVLTVPALGVMSNDGDVDGNPLLVGTPRPMGPPGHGTVTLNSDGSFVYRPQTNFNGLDCFTYYVTDGSATSAVTLVTITVNPVNDPPVAAEDFYVTDEDVVLSIPAPGVLVNDTDIDGDTLTATVVTGPTHGSLTLNSDGSFDYVPEPNYNGFDSFTYKASDGFADSTATVTLTVLPVDDAPVAVNDAYVVDEDTPAFLPAPGVLGNDSDPEGDPLSATLVSGPAHGVLILNANGSFNYTPAANYNGLDSFTYKISDGTAEASASVTLTVRPVNDVPVAQNNAYATDEDTVLNVSAPGVLDNDSDIDGDTLTAIVVTGPAHGVLSLNGDGSFSYTPAANYNGPDSFTYKASDGSADATATVNITVRPVNDAPVAQDNSYATDEDAVLTVVAPGVLDNDSDVDGDALTAALVTPPAHGSLTLNPNGSFTYTPTANYNGPDSFTYKASDGSADATATVTITVRPMNDVPVAQNNAYVTDEDVALNVAAPGVLDNDSDIDGDTLTATVVTGPAHGSLTLNSDGSFNYTPAANYNGPDSFTYKASDGTADATAMVNITVRPVNDVPVAQNNAYATDEDVALTVAAPGVLDNDSDLDGDALTATVVSGPSHGSLTLNSDGSFTYTPALNYNGPDSFTYKASDGTADATATVNITVRPVNDAPVAQNNAYATDEDVALNVAAPGVLDNDSDLDGDSLSATVVSGPAHGSLTLNADGSFNYTPTANYNGSDSFTYKASDGNADATATVNITVRPVNDVPVAQNNSYATDEDTALTVAAPGVLDNDSDLDGDALTATVVSGPSHGTLTLNTDGSFTYTPAGNYHGPDSFTYKASDGSADATATVNITVRPANDVPVAQNNAYVTDEDVALNVAAPGVLDNDSDIDGDTLTATVVTGPTHGSLTLNGDGSFNYTPTVNYNGPDSFTYKTSDGNADATATVNITVRPVNDTPVAQNNAYATDEDVALTVAAPGVLDNDSDLDGDALTATVVSGPSHGSLTLNSDGSFTYTPALNYNGPDSFTYRASDGTANASATVNLTVRPINDAPVAQNNAYATDEDVVLTVSAPGVLDNDSDVDGDALTATVVAGPSHGSLVLNADGSFTYTPALNYNGPDSFTYKASDGSADATATVTLTVRSVNDAPVAQNNSYITDEDLALNIAAPGVLDNDSDVDGDALTATVVSGPSHGTLTLNTDGSFTYTPTANYNGPDSFTYKASDGNANATATVNITVRPINDLPVAQNNSYVTDEDVALNISAPGVLDNDSDVDGDALTAMVVTGPAHGSLTLNVDGSFSYVPMANYNGPDSFTYKASDGTADATATVSITVRPVNDAPVAQNDSYVTDEDVALTIAAPGVLANDSDVDGDALSASVINGPSHGSLTLNGDGSFSYTPAANYNGPDSFTYKVSDGSAEESAIVNLTVRPVNDAPVALNNSYRTGEDVVLNVPAPGILNNDTDIDGDTLTALLVSGPGHGSLTLNSDGSFIYTPTLDYNGPDSFTYKASDGNADATATVNITVGPGNDPPVAQNDSYATDEDVVLDIPAPGVLGNDSDLDGDPLIASVVTGPMHGSLTLSTNGSFVYTPAANYNGPDSFTYKASDGSADATAIVNLTVRPVNDVPVAQNNSYVTDEDVPLSVSAPGVLDNDSDIDGDPLSVSLVSGPAHGSLTLNTDGSFNYTPVANYNGPDSFTYKVSDGSADATATVNITVRPVNDVPVALNNSYVTDEDVVLSIAAPGVLDNDSDIDGDTLTATVVTGPTHGSLTLNSDGSFNYTPAANYNGPDSFTYKASDGSSDAAALVSITVRPVNDAPVAQNNAYITDEDVALNVAAPGVLDNDSDIDGDTLTATVVSGPAHGSLTLNTDGSFNYTPTANYNGPDSFTYKASDGSADAAATVNITVRPVNDAPVAQNNAYTTDEDVALNVAAPGVLDNDSDLDGDALTATVVNGPAHGTLTLNTDGSFTYTPTANYNGPDSFTYKASDGTANATALVSITVRPMNDAPVAQNNSYITDEDVALNVAAPGVLDNDSDLDGDPLTAAVLTGPAHGSLTLNSDGSFSYAPAANYNGPDSFTYKASDGNADATATVSITVRPVNDPPVALNDAYGTQEDVALTIAAPGVLGNDTDIDGDTLSATVIVGPVHGSLTFNPNGSFTYTPAANYNGSDSFIYKASDGSADASATVNITVGAVNNIPVAQNNSYVTDEDVGLNVAAPGVLDNDSDVDGDALTASLVSGPSHGTLTLNSDGSFSYTPAANYHGPDSFTYKASDGTADASATVNIMVRPVNDAPVAQNDAYLTDEDVALNVGAPGVLGNDSDLDGDTLTASLVTAPTHGALTLNSDGSFNYMPAANYNGPDSFTYKVSDGNADATATVSITVRPVNDVPVAQNNSYTTDEDVSLSVAAPGVLDNDSDADGDALTITVVAAPSHGTVTLNPNGSFVYIPTANYNGADSFTYQASDGAAAATATVNLTIRPVNDRPSFVPGPSEFVSMNCGPQTVVNWASSISAGPDDEAGQTLVFILSNDKPSLFLVPPAISPDGTLTYTPAADAYGKAVVTVVLHDDGGTANGGVDTSEPVTFTITVNAPPVVNILSPTNQTIYLGPASFSVLADAFDNDGTVTNMQIYAGSTLVLTTNSNPCVLPVANLMTGTYQFTARAIDNMGASSTSAPVSVKVIIEPPLTVIEAIHLDRQTGLFIEKVQVQNPTTMIVPGVRILITNLSANAKVWNATGTTGDGVPYVQIDQSMNPGGSLTFIIEYYVPTRVTPTRTLIAELTASPTPRPAPTGTAMAITRQLRLNDGSFLIEWMSELGRTYYVQYSSDLTTWKTAMPAVTGTGTRQQWVDNGAPKTESLPSASGNRFYRIVLVP